MYRDYLGILTLVIKRFGITNTSVQNFAIPISSIKTVPKCLRKLKVFFFIKFNIDVSFLARLHFSAEELLLYPRCPRRRRRLHAKC